MRMPNFLIIGAPKAGTTSLYNYLKKHPQIYLPKYKEPHFFSFEGESGGFDGPGEQNLLDRLTTDLQTYQSLFDRVTNEITIGEASTSYLYIPKASERIKYYIPDVKLIAILRHPVERAYSHYLHHRKGGNEVLLDFDKAIREETGKRKNWSPFWHYKTIGFYYAHLKLYFETFDRNQIRIYLYEDLTKDPVKLIQDITTFLSVDSNWIPKLSEKYNVSGLSQIPKNEKVHELLTQENSIKSFLKLLLPFELRQKLKKQVQNINNYKPEQPYKPPLLPEVRQALIAEYRDDILQLQGLLGRDLSNWLI